MNPLSGTDTLEDQMELDDSESCTTCVHVENQTTEICKEEKKAVIEEEMKRMQQLPATSAYAIHRQRVLNKILHLMSIQRSASEDQELELLFAQLSL